MLKSQFQRLVFLWMIADGCRAATSDYFDNWLVGRLFYLFIFITFFINRIKRQILKKTLFHILHNVHAHLLSHHLISTLFGSHSFFSSLLRSLLSSHLVSFALIFSHFSSFALILFLPFLYLLFFCSYIISSLLLFLFSSLILCILFSLLLIFSAVFSSYLISFNSFLHFLLTVSSILLSSHLFFALFSPLLVSSGPSFSNFLGHCVPEHEVSCSSIGSTAGACWDICVCLWAHHLCSTEWFHQRRFLVFSICSLSVCRAQTCLMLSGMTHDS